MVRNPKSAHPAEAAATSKDASASGASASQTSAKPAPRSRESSLMEWVRAIAVAVVLALFIRTFFFQAFKIPSGSMEDTLLVGDFLFVNKFLYGSEIPFTGGVRLPAIRQPKRGDVIVFRSPDPQHLGDDYIKRCVATPGDRVEYRNGVLTVNGEAMQEDFTVMRRSITVLRGEGRQQRRVVLTYELRDGEIYLVKEDDEPVRPASPAGEDFAVLSLEDFTPSPLPAMTIPDGKYLMFGDNRNNSRDSRVWGLLDHKDLRGKAEFIYWSWNGQAMQPRLSRIFDVIR